MALLQNCVVSSSVTFFLMVSSFNSLRWRWKIISTIFEDLSNIITHSFPMHPFSTPWKHQKTLRFYCFQGVEKGCIGNEWVKQATTNSFLGFPCKCTVHKPSQFWRLFRIFLKMLLGCRHKLRRKARWNQRRHAFLMWEKLYLLISNISMLFNRLH